MRQVVAQVPAGRGEDAIVVLSRRDATGLATFEATGVDGSRRDVVVAALQNAAVGPALEELSELGDVSAIVPGGGVFSFEPPAGRPPGELVDVTPRSPVEVILAGRQSVGGWVGFLGYAAAAGIVVWIGLFLETPFLLTAAMLLAPFAGPAMNTAIAVSSGDGGLLRRTIARYAAGIAVTAGVSAGMSLLVGQRFVTGMAAGSVTLSNVAFLLPLVAGAAGALYLVQSEHSSLVSGAAVGMLVAAALAPPVGTIGMAIALARWDLVGRGVFILVLQLAAITVSAAVVLLASGVRPTGHRYASEHTWWPAVGIGVAAVTVVGLVVLQFVTGTSLQRSSVARQVTELTADALRASDDVELLEVTADVPSTDTPGPPRIIVRADAELRPDGAGPADVVSAQLTRRIRSHLADELDGIVPLVDLSVLTPP